MTPPQEALGLGGLTAVSAGDTASGRTWLPVLGPTFEGRHLPGLCLGQALLTGVRGQGQGDAAAAQQKAHLLAASVLRETEACRAGPP